MIYMKIVDINTKEKGYIANEENSEIIEKIIEKHCGIHYYDKK